MTNDCFACGLSRGDVDLPGGQILATDHWLVEHCVGPLGVGTVVLKPSRHVVQVADLATAEAAEFGPLMTRLTGAVRHLSKADQVYVCLWSHKDWVPGHIHFVIQPSWNALAGSYPGPGPALQMAMFEKDELPPRQEVEAFCDRLREYLRS